MKSKAPQRMIDHPAFVAQRKMRAKIEPPTGPLKPSPKTMPTKAAKPIQLGRMKPKK